MEMSDIKPAAMIMTLLLGLLPLPSNSRPSPGLEPRLEPITGVKEDCERDFSMGFQICIQQFNSGSRSRGDRLAGTGNDIMGTSQQESQCRLYQELLQCLHSLLQTCNGDRSVTRVQRALSQPWALTWNHRCGINSKDTHSTHRLAPISTQGPQGIPREHSEGHLKSQFQSSSPAQGPTEVYVSPRGDEEGKGQLRGQFSSINGGNSAPTQRAVGEKEQFRVQLHREANSGQQVSQTEKLSDVSQHATLRDRSQNKEVMMSNHVEGSITGTGQNSGYKQTYTERLDNQRANGQMMYQSEDMVNLVSGLLVDRSENNTSATKHLESHIKNDIPKKESKNNMGDYWNVSNQNTQQNNSSKNLTSDFHLNKTDVNTETILTFNGNTYADSITDSVMNPLIDKGPKIADKIAETDVKDSQQVFKSGIKKLSSLKNTHQRKGSNFVSKLKIKFEQTMKSENNQILQFNKYSIDQVFPDKQSSVKFVEKLTSQSGFTEYTIMANGQQEKDQISPRNLFKSVLSRLLLAK